MNSQHPALNSVLCKLHRGECLTGDELQRLEQQLDELQESAREGSGHFEPVTESPHTTMLSGHATAEGSARLAARSDGNRAALYRRAQEFLVSNIGIGTHRGAPDNRTDAAYAASVHAALQAGINLIDTSLTYRRQRSELSVAVGIRSFIETSGGSRDEIVVCTKGGYLVPEAITAGTLKAHDVVGGMHSLAPAFLSDQIDRSRHNLGLEVIDVYYLHNPETQLEYVDPVEFTKRMRAAFEMLETAVDDGRIRYYGTATWDGYRSGSLSLRELAGLAREIAGDNHHFRFIELPFNAGMQEAQMPPTEGDSVLDIAAELGYTVIASATLLQGRLSRDLPLEIIEAVPGLATDAQRAIQFSRSAPGVASALVGMRDAAHIADNLALADVPPLTLVEYRRLQSSLYKHRTEGT